MESTRLLAKRFSFQINIASKGSYLLYLTYLSEQKQGGEDAIWVVADLRHYVDTDLLHPDGGLELIHEVGKVHITIPARLLTDFVNSLPNERIDMTLSPKTRTLELKCARFEARINGIEAEEFPPIPSIGEGVETRIDTEALRLAIAQVVFAAATEEMRPVLTGVHSEFDGDTLTLAAANGFRLAVHKAPLAQPVAERTEVIIPARALTELQRLLADQEEPVELTINPQKS